MAFSRLAEDLSMEMCSSGSLCTVKGIKARLESDPTIDVNNEDKRGITPLEVAIMYGSKKLVRFLLSKGADPNVAGTKADQSPLMTASQNGYKDIAKALIEKGAIVNSKCKEYERTALHYACMTKDDDYEFDYCNYDRNLYEVRQRERKKEVKNKISCIKLLIEHGAVYQTDVLGMTPICYAGLSRMDKELLPSFAQGGADPPFGYEERIRGLEFRGMSYAIFNQIDIDCAYNSFLEAKQLEQQHGYPPMYSAGDGLSLCFGREECRSVAELEKLKGNKDAVLTEGFLVGGRIIPKEIAPECLWKHLLEHATNKLYEGKDFALCDNILLFIMGLDLPRHTFLDSESVLDKLCLAVYQVGHRPEMIDIVDHALQFVSHRVHLDTLYIKEYGQFSVQTVCKIAMNASVCRGKELLHSTLSQIEELIKQIYLKMEIDTRQQSYQACATYEFCRVLFDYDCTGYHIDTDFLPSKQCVKKVKRVMSRLLHLDNAAYTTSDGETILHLLAAQEDLLNKWYDIFVSITEMVIRRGCPVDAKNHKGLTAKEILNNNVSGEVSDAKLSTMRALLSEH